MNRSSLMLRAFAGLFVLSFALATVAFGQGVTTSAISGFVTDNQGKPVSGVTIVAVHDESGTRAQTITGANGQYNIPGLRAGGPYTVTAESPTYHSVSQAGIYLSAGVTQDVSFNPSTEVVKMEAFQVAETRDTTFSAERTGNVSNFATTQIENMPIVRQDVQEIANLDPRINIVENTSTGEFQMSAQGQNYRYNSFLIDGLESNDPFGLNGNGFASQRSPVPLTALENFSVNFSPYDVRYTGFTGALLNAVTKSGTNTFHGSIDYRYTGQSLRGENPNSHAKEPFHERSYTATFGGPIIKDKLFFFLSYDDFRRVSGPLQTQNFIPTDANQVSLIIARAKALGYDPGSLSEMQVTYQKTYLAKIDWNISDKHRAKFSYRRTDGSSPQFANYTNTFTTSFSNYWYQAPRISDNYVAQLDSQWTSNFHTEATVAYLKYNGTPKNNGTPFPEVNIGGVTGHKVDTNTDITSGDIMLGTEFSRQFNQIYTNDKLGKFYADYTLGNHVILAGVDGDRTEYINRFVQAYYGTYTFSSVANWIAGTPISNYQDAKVFPGYDLNSAFAAWTATNYGALLQDTWRPNSRLTLTGGLRLTYPYIPTAPIAAAGFSTAGFTYNGAPITKNNTTNSGNYTVAPRFSFNYEPDLSRKTSVRGGIGLFSGTNPAVWLSNSYSNAGAIGRVSVSNPAGLSFVADPNNQPVPSGNPPAPVINVTDPKFRTATYWKANLGFDHELPFLGLIFTLEGSYNKVEKAPFVVSLNMKRSAANGGLSPDGRERYAGNIYPGYNTGVSGVPTGATTTGSASMVNNTAFNSVLYLTDSNKGSERDVTIGVRRPLKNGWEFSAYWTHMNATEASPFTSSVAASNFNGRAVRNPNEDVASNSNYVIPDKIVARATREFRFFNAANSKTFISATFRAQSGHSYSWVYRGDANGDGQQGNDLLYVPTGPNDPLVVWNSTAERDAFFAFAQSSGLAKFAGSVVPRNSDFSPWQKTVDLHFSQQIPVHGNMRLEAFVDCVNFANLLNKKWGVVEGIDFPYTRRVLGTTINAQNQYVYFFNSSTLDASAQTFTDLSRWQVTIGARLRF